MSKDCVFVDDRDKNLILLYDNILWVFEYDHQKKTLMTQLTGYGGKCRIFKNSRQVMAFIEETYGQPMD